MRAMPWLVRGDRVLASLKAADTPGRRVRGLLGRSSCHGAPLLCPARSVYAVGIRFDLDVAHLDGERRVVSTVQMAPRSLGRPARGARAVLGAETGSIERWGLAVGDDLAVRVGDGADEEEPS